MRKIHIILPLLALSVIWAQKEVPGLGSTSETTGDERLNGKKIQPIDADIVQQIRMLKVNKEKAFMKKQILKGVKYEPKTFKVNNENSKLLVIKKIIDQIKDDNQNTSVERINFNNVTSSRELNRTINYKKGSNSN
tara:strand:- start:252 stop:659 length:408 start_codon:yes stop_codon:yes gene_type:complete